MNHKTHRSNSFFPGLFIFVILAAISPVALFGEEAPHKMCGTMMLPRHHSSPTLKWPTARISPLFNANSTLDFNVYNFTNNKFDTLTARYRAEGTSCYVFVPDEYFTSSLFGGKDPGSMVEELATKFQNQILKLNRDWIGPEPNPGVDGDPKIYILLTDIKDGAGFGGGFVAGFFNSGDQLNEEGSNKKDIIYMDLSPGKFGDSSFYGTLAHEFSHLIHFIQGGGGEFRWVDEGTATLIDYLLTGEMLTPQVPQWVSNPNIALVEDSANFWFGSNPFPYYGQALVFCLYLKQRFGGASEAGQMAFIRSLVAEDRNGREGIAAVTGLSFNQIFDDFSAANVVNSLTSGGGIYGYQEEFDSISKNDIKLPVTATRKNINVTGSLNVTSSVVNWGNRYFEYTGNGSLDLVFKGADSAAPYAVTLIQFPVGGETTVTPVTLDSGKSGSLSIGKLGSAISKAIVRVSVEKPTTNDTGNSDYSFTITGTGVPTTQEGTLVAVVNPGNKSSVTLMAKLSDGFAAAPSVQVVVNGSTQTIAMNRVSNDLYQGPLNLPRGFTGTYSATLTGSKTGGTSLSSTFTFSHTLK